MFFLGRERAFFVITEIQEDVMIKNPMTMTNQFIGDESSPFQLGSPTVDLVNLLLVKIQYSKDHR